MHRGDLSFPYVSALYDVTGLLAIHAGHLGLSR